MQRIEIHKNAQKYQAGDSKYFHFHPEHHNIKLTMEGYRNDLAYVHDAGFGDFAKQAGPELLQILRQNRIHKGLVVDLGCGSGLWAQRLIRSGYDVLGIDLSPAMIRIARKRAPEARFVQDSFLKAKLPPCAAVTAIGECFNYLFDASNGRNALSRFFGRVFRSLQPGGMFLFDVVTPDKRSKPKSQQNNRVAEDWAILYQAEEDAAKRILTRRITTFRRIGKLYRRDEEIHRCLLYEGGELAEELRRKGFRVRVVRSYGKFKLYKNRIGFLAKKPE